jgi:hypothetical protein
MASLLFGNAIDYERVRIHARRYMPFQPRNCAMTPNGSMYFHQSCFLPDYTRGDPAVVHTKWSRSGVLHTDSHVAATDSALAPHRRIIDSAALR